MTCIMCGQQIKRHHATKYCSGQCKREMEKQKTNNKKQLERLTNKTNKNIL